jgi:hypothetical protein
MDRLHWRSLLAKSSATRDSHVTVTTVLTLATLCGATINRNDPISVALPTVAKCVAVAYHYSCHYPLPNNLIHNYTTSLIEMTEDKYLILFYRRP